MKTVKITSPIYVGSLAQMIQSYYNKVNEHKLSHVTYQSLYTYFTWVVQWGGDKAEFHVCFDDEDNPLGFGLWRIMDLPYQGAVYFEHLFKATKNHDIVKLLVQQFVDYGKEHRCPYYVFDTVNPAVASALRKATKEVGADFIEIPTFSFVARLGRIQ